MSVVNEPPNWYAYDRYDPCSWGDVKECKGCHTRSHGYAYYGHICKKCGCMDFENIVGRWIRISPKWMFWKDEGYWQIKQ